MSVKHLLNGFTYRKCSGLMRSVKLAVAVSSLCVTSVFAQSDADGKENTDSDQLSKLYDCSSFYTLANRCYSTGRSEDSKRLSVTTFQARDKIIHLIYINSKRAGILPETSQANMLSSFNKMMKETNGSCQAVLELKSSLGPSCDRMIENTPKQPYDKGQKSGNLSGIVPASID